jgi:hypothetical protein
VDKLVPENNEDFVPLILYRDDESCAEFCERCGQATWFGLH